MIGTITNVCTILVGTLIGATCKKKFNDSIQSSIFLAIGTCALMVGISATVNANNAGGSYVLLIINMALGAIIGTTLKLHDRFLGLINKFSKGNGSGEGLVTAILLFCIGTLSILGPIESALYSNHTLLFTNASLDFITSIALSSAYGPIIGFAAIAVFLFQGSIYALAYFLSFNIPPFILHNLSLTGGLLIVMSGLSILKLKDIKTTDYLPALFISPLTAYIGEIITKSNLLNFN